MRIGFWGVDVDNFGNIWSRKKQKIRRLVVQKHDSLKLKSNLFRSTVNDKRTIEPLVKVHDPKNTTFDSIDTE